MYKPPDHNSLSPYLIVDDAEAALVFIKAVFGADPDMIHRSPDGAMAHVEVRIDDSVLMIGQVPGADSPANLHVYVADVDDSFAKALAAGGTQVQAVASKGDGDRRGGVTDPTGTIWWLATHEGYNNAT